jgi:uncharacterized membrane protein
MANPTNELRADKIEFTLQQLAARIKERFPNSGLLSVCRNLVVVANTTAVSAQRIGQPNYGFRIMSGIVVLLVAMAALYIARMILGQLDERGG